MTNFGKTTFAHVQQATAITVPITTMEWRIIFIRQIMDNFKNTVRLMSGRASVDRSSKTAFNFSKHHVKLFCKPPK